MSYGYDRRPGPQGGTATTGPGAATPGKRTLTEQIDAGPPSATGDRAGAASDVDAHGPPSSSRTATSRSR
jgi:hypothetical protein